MQKILFIASFLLLSCAASFAQKAERSNVRAGNKEYAKEKFTEAEISYRKSLDVNPNSKEGVFNLGNALFKQQKYKEALQQYEIAASNDQLKAASAMHNMGNVFLTEKDYAKAVDMYKRSLIMNPKDNETRYNLAYAQKKLKEQQQQQQNQDQKGDDQDQKDKEQQEKEKEKQQQEQQKQDNQDQNKDQDKDKEQQQQQPKPDQMTQENAQQILDAFLQDEKQTQEKMKEKKAQQQKKQPRAKQW